jgi:hypothetical protein
MATGDVELQRKMREFASQIRQVASNLQDLAN